MAAEYGSISRAADAICAGAGHGAPLFGRSRRNWIVPLRILLGLKARLMLWADRIALELLFLALVLTGAIGFLNSLLSVSADRGPMGWSLPVRF